MVNIEINGTPIQARAGSMLIEAADEAGIAIPRFCYHKKLSVAASCRMCLVEVEKVGKPLPACATPVTEGMKVWTRSPKAIAAQRNVMEFLLINHPLDCPICDQGGECDLQEMAMGYGRDVSRFAEGKRAVPSPDIGPLVATDMTRCIHCTRCVRFGEEIAGVMDLGAPGRGEHMHIGTYVEKSLSSEVAGNIIDLCPVGALTSKPYRYSARPWELTAMATVSPHDCVGANMAVDVRRNKVMRVRPRENEEVNENWLADRDRFSYPALEHAERLTAPQIKKDGVWQTVDWEVALTTAAEGLRGIVEQQGAASLGALAAYTATTEELYLLQKLVRGMGSHNVDHRLRQLDLDRDPAAPVFPTLGQGIADLEQQNAVLLVGSNIRKEQPLLGLRIRKAALRGAAVMAINSQDYDFHFPLQARRIIAPHVMVRELAAVAQALLDMTGEAAPKGFAALLEGNAPAEQHRTMAERLKNAEKATVMLGNSVAYHPAQQTLVALGALVARLAGARLSQLAEGGNSVGAWLAGAVPHRAAAGIASGATGLDWRGMTDADLRGYLLLGVEPTLDCIDPQPLLASLHNALVVALTPYATDSLRACADVLLPVALFPETSGSFVNTEGRWQSFAACVTPPGEARPAWKVLRVLGNLCALGGFTYDSSEEVRDELREACDATRSNSDIAWRQPAVTPQAEGLVRIVDFPIYAVDNMVRRSAPLQQTPDAATASARLNVATAQRQGLGGAERVRVSQGGGECILPLQLDERIPDGCVYVPAGMSDTAALGLGASVELQGA